MNDHDTQTLPRPVHTAPHGGGDDGGASGDALQRAQQALARSRDLRAEMERLLGGIELDDLRNGGGQ